MTFLSHEAMVYSAVWSPRIPGAFASVAADGRLFIWNSNQPAPQLTIQASTTELLTCDWCKYNENIIATGGCDGLIKCWDLRAPSAPVVTLSGHERAVKKVVFSGHRESIISSVSYDFTTRIWDVRRCVGGDRVPLLRTFYNHSEFAYGLDLNLTIPGLAADCGWDQLVVVSNIGLE